MAYVAILEKVFSLPRNQLDLRNKYIFSTFRVSNQREEPCEIVEIVEDEVVKIQGRAWLA